MGVGESGENRFWEGLQEYWYEAHACYSRVNFEREIQLSSAALCKLATRSIFSDNIV